MDLLVQFAIFCLFALAELIVALIWMFFLWGLYIGVIRPVGGKILAPLTRLRKTREAALSEETLCAVLEDPPADDPLAERFFRCGRERPSGRDERQTR